MTTSYEKVSVVNMDDRPTTENSPTSLRSGISVHELEVLKSPTKTSYLSSNQSSDLHDQNASTPQISRDEGKSVSNTPESSHTKRSLLYYSDDEDEDLGRYSVQFRRTLNGSVYELQEKEYRYGHGKWNMYSEPTTNPAKRLFRNIQHARLESRRKRLEKLISLPDNSCRSCLGRFSVCLGSWCDLLDKGLVIFLVTLTSFVGIIMVLDEDEIVIKKFMLGLGIPMFILRIAWRPIKHFLCDLRYQGQSSSMIQHSILPIPIV